MSHGNTAFVRCLSFNIGESDRAAQLPSCTRAKKEELPTVLRHPEAPPRNNACENEARVAARRRDVSLHTKTKEGTQACDTMTGIVRTARKLGVSAFKYIADRTSEDFRLSSLADPIRARTRDLDSANGCRGP